MNEKYKAELIVWGIRTGAMIVLAVVLALIKSWFGITLNLEPPPPAPTNVAIIVEPPPGSAEPPKVTVHQLVP